MTAAATPIRFIVTKIKASLYVIEELTAEELEDF